MPRATLDDVAKLAGVSIKTASRVVNKEPNVRSATEEKVKKAILELSYRPNQSARNLASQRSHLIGLVYDDPAAYDLPSSGYIINMQQGVLKACKNFNYDLLIHPFNFRDKGVDEELKSLVEHARPIGIILAAPLSNMRKIVRAIENTDTPLVRMSPGATNGKHSTIATNDREISAEMTRYLVSLGHKRIAFIKGDSGHKAVSNRFLGYKDGLKEAGLAYSEAMVCEGDNSIGSGEAAGTTLLQRKKSPTAIFAANDDMAAGVVRVADRLGINVPAQLSIAGFDDIPLARQIYPALTTIRQPLATMAERAAVSLIQATRNMPPTRIVEIVPAQIQIRDSTGPAPN